MANPSLLSELSKHSLAIHYNSFNYSSQKNFFCFSYAMSEAADSWLAMMDRYLTRGDSSIDENLVKNILRLVDIYYDALDAPKKGGKVSFIFCCFNCVSSAWSYKEILAHLRKSLISELSSFQVTGFALKFGFLLIE